MSLNINHQISTIGSATGAIAHGLGTIANIEHPFETCFSSGSIAAATDSKFSIVHMYARTTDTTVTPLKIGAGTINNAPTGIIVGADNQAILFNCDIVGISTSSSNRISCAYNLKFLWQRRVGTSNITAPYSSKTVLWENNDINGDMTGCDVTITGDTTNGIPVINVTGIVSNINWTATVMMTKVQG
jgi:hypothetical protein